MNTKLVSIFSILVFLIAFINPISAHAAGNCNHKGYGLTEQCITTTTWRMEHYITPQRDIYGNLLNDGKCVGIYWIERHYFCCSNCGAVRSYVDVEHWSHSLCGAHG